MFPTNTVPGCSRESPALTEASREGEVGWKEAASVSMEATSREGEAAGCEVDASGVPRGDTPDTGALVVPTRRASRRLRI